MRILVILNSLYTGGAEFSTLSFYGWLSKKDYEVKVVCLKRAMPSYNPEQFGVDSIEFIDGYSFLSRLTNLNRIIKEFKPQVVHSILFEANVVARFSKIVLANFVHLESLVNEMYSPFRLQDPNVNLVKLMGYCFFDWITQLAGVTHYHANGISVANHYQQKLRINSNRITVIPRGRLSNSFVGNTSNRSKIREEFNAGEKILIVTVGRQEYQKAHDVLLSAIASLTEFKDSIRLVIVGREGNYTSHIQHVIDRNGLQKQVVIAGHRDDVPSILASSDIFVFPSRFEGLPGALIEAEAAGLPIVCSNIANNQEVVEENVNALLFPVDNITMLAEKLKMLIIDESKRKFYGENSIRIFNEKFLLEKVHLRMEQLLKELVSKSYILIR